MAELAEGAEAPDFDLPADNGRFHLADRRGRIVVLYFYPKDDTSGCTIEAIDFTKLSAAFAEAGADVVGVSPDTVKSHCKFRDKHGLGITLVSDEDKGMLEAYGVWAEKSMYGRTYMGVERTTMIVGRDGRLARIWRKVKVPGHAAEVLEAVKALG